MGQLTVSTDPAIGSPGDLATLHTAEHADIKTGINAEASATLVVGTMVKRHATLEKGCLRMAALVDKATAHGIVTRAHSLSSPSEILQTTIGSAVVDSLSIKTPFGVGRDGEYVVMITENVAVGDAVRVRCVASATEIAGSFRTTADSTDCLLLPTDAFYWVKGGAIDGTTGWGVAVLHVDMNHMVRAVADT